LSFIGILLVLVSSQQNNTIKDVVKLNYYNWLCIIKQYPNPCICFCKRLTSELYKRRTTVTQQDVKIWGGHVLDHKSIGSIRGNFFVPAYQRGYRWTRDDVQRLLDDVWESKQTNGDYNLQPVVTKLINSGTNYEGNSEQPEG